MNKLMILCAVLLSNLANAQYPMQNYNMDIGNPANSGYIGFQQGAAMANQNSIDMNAIEQQYQYEQQLRLQKQQLQIQQQLLQQYQINSQQLYRR